MEQNKICPLLTTNTVVDENNTVKIGTQPVDNSVTVERNLYKHLYEDLLNKVMAR